MFHLQFVGAASLAPSAYLPENITQLERVPGDLRVFKADVVPVEIQNQHFVRTQPRKAPKEANFLEFGQQMGHATKVVGMRMGQTKKLQFLNALFFKELESRIFLRV